jgi:hypothetical protein
MEYLLSGASELTRCRRLTRLVGNLAVMLGAGYGQPHKSALMPNDPDEQRREDRRAKDDPESGLSYFPAQK